MLDEIQITVSGGSGGNGIVSFRRERFIPRGGPDGGDGGRGGSVVIEADPAVSVLDKLRRMKTVVAEDGVAGGPQRRHGKNGEDVVVKVPIGTILWDDEDAQIADLDRAGMRMIVAAGGLGGKGNARLATSTRRAPRIAERGLPGEKRTLRLELRLLAEVGLVGLPNAGKSSLLRAISEARPKVGAYPFTTLEPHLGIAEQGYERLVLADIPGLIEGAHTGAGLGMQFLQHIRRTGVLVHIVDIQSEDPAAEIETVRAELRAFGESLEEKAWLAALNKIDLVPQPDAREEIAEKLRGHGIDVYAISALTGEGVAELLTAVFAVVKRQREAAGGGVPPEPVVIRVPDAIDISVVKQRSRYVVKGRRPEEAVLRLGVDSEEARAELSRRLRRMGVVNMLRKAGVRDGDWVRIAREDIQWPL